MEFPARTCGGIVVHSLVGLDTPSLVTEQAMITFNVDGGDTSVPKVTIWMFSLLVFTVDNDATPLCFVITRMYAQKLGR